MGFLLPAQGSAAREMMGDLADFVELVRPENRAKLPRFCEALRKGRAYMKTADKAASRVVFVCFGNDNFSKQHGKIVLLSIGRRGGWKLEHVFGDA